MVEPAPMPSTAHEHARALGALGLRVLPIKPGHKRPPMASWQHAATDDADKIDNWYGGLYRDAGVGLALGPQPNGSYLFAIDIDTHDPAHNGWDALADLEETHGKLPDTWRSLTGAGGAHLIFSVPAGTTVRNQQASGNRIAAGIDVRGDGGQIVVAPTVHPDTQRTYEWEAGFAPWEHTVARAPRWLLDLVAEPEVTHTATPSATSSDNTRDDSLFDAHRADWDWHAELARQGWQLTIPQPHNATDTHWTRPGKDPRKGNSGVLHEPDGPFVIFTTEMPDTWRQAGTPTRNGVGYAFGPFGFYAATEHGGDRSQAARTLSDRYGASDVDLGALIAESHAATTPVTADPDAYDAELLGMLVDWGSFWSTDHQAEEWLWEPVIAARRATAIFAAGGVGKSLIVLRMVVDLVQRGVRVLYLDYEMTPDDLYDRLSEMGVDETVDLTTLRYAQLPSLPAFDTPEGGRAINRLAELVDAEIVIIDTFARAVEGDENDADTVRQFYRMTGLHLKAAGRAFVRIDHAGKDVSKGQRGSSAKNDDVDVVWRLERVEDGYKLYAKKRRMGWVPETVVLERSDGPFVLAVKGGESWPVGTSELAAVLDELDIDPEWGEKKIRPALRDAGHRAENKVLRAAIKYRRMRSESFHFADDLTVNNRRSGRDEVTTQSVTTAPESVRRTSGAATSGAPSGAVAGDDENHQVDELRRSVRRSAAQPPEVSAAQCASLKEAHAAPPEPDDPDFDPLSILDGI